MRIIFMWGPGDDPEEHEMTLDAVPRIGETVELSPTNSRVVDDVHWLVDTEEDPTPAAVVMLGALEAGLPT